MFATNFVAQMLLVGSVLFGGWPIVEGRSVEEYCYAKDPVQPQNSMFSTKTAYEFVRRGLNDTDYKISDCEPTQFWILTRHGTRLPPGKTMKDLAELGTLRDKILENYKTHPNHVGLCADDLNNLKNWKWDYNITPDHDSYLVAQGYKDMEFLAERYQNRFPDLFISPYSESNYHFRYSDLERTKRSAETFAERIFGKSIALPEPPEIDLLLNPNKFCPKWQNQSYKAEENKFIQLEIYKNVIRDVSTRLGFDKVLNDDDVENMYEMCRYDKAWEVDAVSPWCAVLTLEHVKILEYKEDLKYFYKSGPGIEFNRELGCGILKDMLDTFTATVQDNSGPRVTAYFGHTTTLSLMRSALRLPEDPEPLRAEDFHKNANRKFRMSELDSFANNIAVILYKCNATGSETNGHKVLFLRNESPMDLDGCTGGVCTWEKLLQKYGSTAATCSMYGCHEDA